jgi:hypothetical protein
MGNQNQQRQAPYQNNSGYQRGGNSNNNQGWRQDAGPPNRQRQYESFNQPQPPPQQQQSSNLEETMSKFIEMQIQHNQQQQKFQQETQVYQRGNDAVLRNLETQIGQIAKQVANKNDQGGSSSFNANTTTNPKEHCKSITTRSGKEIGKGIGDNLQTEKAVVEAREKQEGDKKEREMGAEENNNEEGLVEKEKNQKK